MFKQKSNDSIINSTVINTRLHDALVFINEKPNSEKYKNNVLYKGLVHGMHALLLKGIFNHMILKKNVLNIKFSNKHCKQYKYKIVFSSHWASIIWCVLPKLVDTLLWLYDWSFDPFSWTI